MFCRNLLDLRVQYCVGSLKTLGLFTDSTLAGEEERYIGDEYGARALGSLHALNQVIADLFFLVNLLGKVVSRVLGMRGVSSILSIIWS